MFCPNCGRQLPDDAKFCSECGTPLTAIEPAAEAGDAGADQTAIEPAAQAAPPMGWFKFIIWVQLFISALSLAAAGIMLLTGTAYVVDGISYADLVYDLIDGLRAIDLVFGVAFVALAVFALYVRQQLAGFKKGAPKLYLTLLGVNIAVQFLYAFVMSIAVGVELADVVTVSELVQVITSLVMIIVNKYYFARREHLFTN